MSLVNDMLNDLDDRRLERAGEDVNLDWMSGQKINKRQSMLMPILWVSAVVVFLFIAYKFWQLNNTNSARSLKYLSATEAVDGATPSDKPALAVSNIIDAPEPAAPAPSENNNASDNVAKAESLEADRIETKGIEASRIEAASVVAIEPEKKAIEENLDASVVPDSSTGAEEFAQAIPVKKMASQSDSALSAGSPKSAQPIKRVPTVSFEQLDAQNVQRADALIKAGQINEAENQLRSFVSGNVNAVKSGDKLVSLWLSTKNYTQAEAMIDQLRLSNPDHLGLITSQARLYVLTNRVSASVDLLMSHKPLLKGNTAYYELLGFAARENKQYQLSVQAYQGLLEFDSRRGDWWVGMAIALDLGGESEQAREAYKQGMNSRGLTIALRDYAQQRLSML